MTKTHRVHRKPLEVLIKDDLAGHPKFHQFTSDLSDLHARKNHDYASGGSVLGNFERMSKLSKLYPGMDWTTPEGVALHYMFKQFDAYMWMKSQGHASRTGEGVLERLRDCGVYFGILFAMESDNLEIAHGPQEA